MKRITTDEAAKIIGASPVYVRMAIREGTINIGSYEKRGEESKRYGYNISPYLLERYTGKDIKKELRNLRGEENYMSKGEITKRLKEIHDSLGAPCGETEKLQADILKLIKDIKTKELEE